MEGKKETRRNLVVIVSDTLRADFLAAYGADFIPTPNIDALAACGITFDNAVTPSTVCGPARASILTGLDVSGHDSWTNGIPIPEGIGCFPERLTEAGYATAAFGGLDHIRIGRPCGVQYANILGENDKREYLDWLRQRHPDETEAYCAGEDGCFRYEEWEHWDRYFCDRATEFIDCFASTHRLPADPHRTAVPAREGEDVPFCVLYGAVMPHEPYTPPREVRGRVDPARIPPIRVSSRRAEELPEVERYRRTFLNTAEELRNEPEADRRRMERRLAYCDMICAVDDLVGRVVDCLKRNGVYENTTILLTADHGSCEDDFNVRTKGPFPYTSQLFVPLILSNHPGLSGREEMPCSTLDLGATLLDIAGDTRKFGLSRSLLGMMDGRVPKREAVYSEFNDTCKRLVDARYTFSYYPFTGKYTLFDRLADPDLSCDLSGEPEFAPRVAGYLAGIIDRMAVAKKPRFETYDLAPGIRRGVEEIDPHFLDDYEIAYPCSPEMAKRLEAAGLDGHYNDFCRGKKTALDS